MNPVNLMQALHKSCVGLHWHEHGVASAGGQRCCLDGRPAATEVESGATTTTRPAAEARQNIAEDKIAKKNDRLELPGLDKNL